MNYWLAVGSPENWRTAFEYGSIWGLKLTQKLLWDTLKEGDKLIFYATRPVGGLIGYGTLRSKMKQNKPLWPEEIKQNTVIWPLRFEFDAESCFPGSEWVDKKISYKELFPRAGFQRLNESLARKLVLIMLRDIHREESSKVPIIAEETEKYEAEDKEELTSKVSHSDLQDKIIEIGKLQRYLVNKEYPFDTGKLDVVWRRVTNSVPTFVFEIQVGGDIYHALGKLKHAFDLWNSHIFMVASEADIEKANRLLCGTFHEINSHIKFIDLDRVEELYKRKKAYFELEKDLGIY